MYQYFCAVIIGIVEGMTEYLPVSSTGHMIIVSSMLNFTGDLAKFFEVFIQLGAILSVLVVYKEKFIFMLDTHHWFRKKGPSCFNIIISMIPACVMGLLFHGMIKKYLFGPETVIIGLIIGGIFMIYGEKKGKRKNVSVKNVEDINTKQAFKIGLFQCLSLWPGFSRSGSTIAGGLLLGVSRKAAADFSFIMAVPLMFLATLYDLLKNIKFLHFSDIGVLLTGFIVSFIVAYLSIVWFLKFLNKYNLTGFALYRFLVAIVAFLFVI
ncbi:undecaprenyl-diphosphate phosphatase [Dialister micraerophilus]|uniref:undecaprenyl-diphosphate phosphatase n=1 Tax=Dialister micraerophilus TaxID=309120 RepID=UPI0023F52A35|nr:undecaprenyl-diphosphate phosphatase [Dialister micraerophilus]